MRLEGFIEKGWGSELIFATNDLYCGKLLKFNSGSKFSMHFHSEKHETWHVLSGKFIVRWINTKDASTDCRVLLAGDTWTNEPLFPHQLICEEAGSIVEVSTPDSVEDNHRVFPGDSQEKI